MSNRYAKLTLSVLLPAMLLAGCSDWLTSPKAKNDPPAAPQADPSSSGSSPSSSRTSVSRACSGSPNILAAIASASPAVKPLAR